MERRERDRDLERLLTFVDAVVAIAITLLVLPLAEIGSEAAEHSTADLLREHTVDLLAFFLSFTVIAQLWLAQHRIVSCLVRQSGAVIRLLLLWTLTIVFLPFPTALVAGTSDSDGLTKVVYIGSMMLSSALLAALALAISRDRSLRDTEHPPDPLHSVTVAGAFLVALAVSLAVPTAGYWPLLLLMLAEPAAVAIRRRWKRPA